jgi:hypothetical protein
MAKRKRTKGQTTQWPKEEGQTTQWPKEKDRQHNGCLFFFFLPLCCLSFSPFSFGHCVVCPLVLFLLAIMFSVL